MDKKKEGKYLNKLLDVYYDSTVLFNVETKVNKFLASYVTDFCRGDVLEMGVSTGEWLDLLTKKADTVDVVDAVEEFLSRQKKIYGDKICTFHSLFEEFDPPKKYDTINMAHILEHVVDTVEILKLAKGWLSPDGVINIVVPHANSIHRRLGVVMGISKTTTELGELDIKVGHRRVYDIKTMEHHIKEAELRIRFRKGLIFKPLSNCQLESLDDRVIKGMLELGSEIPIEYSGTLFYQCGK